MTADHLAEAMLGILLVEINAVNTNADLTAAGLSIKSDALVQKPAPPGSPPGDTSPYEYLKVGDRGTVPPGLTVCFVPENDRSKPAAAPRIARTDFTVNITAYIRGVIDPEKVRLAKRGVAEALTAVFNNADYRTITVNGQTAKQCRVGERSYWSFGAGETKMGETLHAVVLEWTAWAYLAE